MLTIDTITSIRYRIALAILPASDSTLVLRPGQRAFESVSRRHLPAVEAALRGRIPPHVLATLD